MTLEKTIQDISEGKKHNPHQIGKQKNRFKKILLATATAIIIATTSPNINAQEKPKEPEITQETKKKEKPPRFMGIIYAEGSYFSWGNLKENPANMNTLLGYNILKRKPAEGVLLLPYIRLNVKANKPEFYWDNRADMSGGAAILWEPLIMGIEGGYRESFKKQGKDGGFLRVWGGYWNKFEGKNFTKSKNFPLRPELIQYAEFEANTLTDNVTIDGRLEGYLDILNVKGFKAGPYIAGKINYDVQKEPWNRYGQGSGGIKITKGPLALFVETGYRGSFHNKGLEGDYISAILGIWLPLTIK